MNKIGVHALTFIGDIENHSIESCLSRVAKIGYDVMELPLLNPDALDTNFVSKTYEKFNIENYVIRFLEVGRPPDRMPEVDQRLHANLVDHY